MHIDNAKKRFLEELEKNNYAQSSVKNYDAFLSKTFFYYLRSAFTIIDTDEITKDSIEGYLVYVRKLRHKWKDRPLKENTIENMIKAAKLFLTFLVDYEYMEYDFRYLFEGIKRKKTRIIRNVLNESQIEKILSCLHERTWTGFRDKVIFELLYQTGIRKSEIIHLEMYDINFEDHRLFIRQGKGRKDRMVPLGNYSEKLLKEYIEKVRPALVQDNIQDNRLFISKYGKGFSLRGIQSVMEKYAKLSGIKFSCHTWRHTFATHLLKHGAGILYIQRLLGHEQVSTTQSYTRVYPGDLKKVVEKLHPRNAQSVRGEIIVLPGERKSLYRIDDAVQMYRFRKVMNEFQNPQALQRFGADIRSKRVQLQMSQCELGKKLGMNYRQVSVIESGKRINTADFLKAYRWVNQNARVTKKTRHDC